MTPVVGGVLKEFFTGDIWGWIVCVIFTYSSVFELREAGAAAIAGGEAGQIWEGPFGVWAEFIITIFFTFEESKAFCRVIWAFFEPMDEDFFYEDEGEEEEEWLEPMCDDDDWDCWEEWEMWDAQHEEECHASHSECDE